ncbi:MAG: ATP-dependent DNA helicase RecG [Chloroflexi bacterium]|nr:ATP-dependent DNA helicase RecG [Chloroflexota bacterium]
MLHGVGPGTARKLEGLGLFNLGHMLYYFPRRYDDFTRLKTINRLAYGDEVTVIGNVEDIRLRPIRRGAAKMVEALVGDGTGSLRVTWFNQPWITRTLRAGMQIKLQGKVDQYLGQQQMNSPEWEPLEPEELVSGRIQPVYPLSAGVNGKWLRRQMETVVNYWANRVVDPVPESIRVSADLLDLANALKHIHIPGDWDLLHEARQRLAFDELLLLQLGVLAQKRDWQGAEGLPVQVPDEWLGRFVGALPFPLTSAQERALAEVRADMATGRPMNRLLQGDVGSGKTVVAAAGLALAARAGAQGALMAPTSILAEQHYHSLTALLAGEGAPAGLAPHEIRLLLGATPAAEKAEIRAGLAAGSIKLVIGTHALIEAPVEFASLGLAVVDEQHRFGVAQRAALRGKGANPHLLVMTATPIPRSLALTVYGYLDLSVMDEMPPGRQPIETRVLRQSERQRAFEYIRAQVQRGRQAFVIYPLVEESEKIDARAAVAEYEMLQRSVFPELKLGLLHGRLNADEKETVMAAFAAGETQIVVSTSVVEVGVDVPNASVILVEGANRFGLSQLHQFRGRVGRGQYKSYCLLISDAPGGEVDPRLKAMEETTDGFVLAERDLEQRGPGDFLGVRQSGFAELNMAKLTDIKLIEKARRAAVELFELDPALERPEHRGLALRMRALWGAGQGDIS